MIKLINIVIFIIKEIIFILQVYYKKKKLLELEDLGGRIITYC